MSRILVLSHSLPDMEPEARVESQNCRAQQLVEPLLGKGHTLAVCARAFYNKAKPWEEYPLRKGRLEYYALDFRDSRWMPRLQHLHDSFKPDAVVASAFFPCLFATRLATDRPVWMDVFGDPTTENQVRLETQGSNRGLRNAVEFERRILQRGDIFSACSDPQRFALVGKLAALGRLDFRTSGYPFVHRIPPAAPELPAPAAAAPMLRGSRVPQEAFLVLWSGGYNVWADLPTLFAGLEEAMRRDPKLHFVSTGWPAVDERPFRELESLIAASSNRARYLMLGWQNRETLLRLYGECDVSVLTARHHYDALIGAPVRLMEMLAAGLPVVTSLGWELSHEIAGRGAGLGVPIGDPAALADSLLRLSSDPEERRRLSEGAARLAADEHGAFATTAPLLRWAERPFRAPDAAPEPASARLRDWARWKGRELLWTLFGRAG